MISGKIMAATYTLGPADMTLTVASTFTLGSRRKLEYPLFFLLKNIIIFRIRESLLYFLQEISPGSWER